VAGMVGLQLGANPLRVWRQGRKQGALEFAGLFLLGTVLARAGARDPLIVAVLCLPMAIVYWSLERTVRVEELARREAALTAWRDLEQLKSDFMRSVSHELRTPLSLVLGFAELLRDRARQSLPPDADAAECAEQIHANARLLARLVDDLLDFASIERGEITLQPRDYDLAAALADLVAGLRRQPGGERLVARLPAHLPVHADPARVAQAVYNLIANAQKYAPGGPITVRAALAQSQVDGPLDTVRIEVEDEGPGIPADEQPRVWEKFYRGRAVSGLNLATGTGIGLALVKTLTEAQRGRVGVRSAPGRGARFWIELPAADLPPAHAAAQGTSHSPVVVRLAGGSPPA
jgi:signal transduction histidine kinase